MAQTALVESPKRSITLDMAHRFGMEAKPFEATLRATVVPSNCSQEEFAAFLLVAKQYNLNPITKEIFAFPKRGGGIQPIVSVDGWANLINSHPQCDGWDFEDEKDENGNLISITCRMYRKDRSHPMEATEYMAECARDTDTWKKWPRRMLRHKALIQAARYAFGFAGIVDPDEAERFTVAPQGHYSGTPGPRLVPPSAPSLAPIVAEDAYRKVDVTEVTSEQVQDQSAPTASSDDALADWINDQIAEAKCAASMDTLDEIDGQVCSELEGAGRDDLQALWNEAYQDRRNSLTGKRR